MISGLVEGKDLKMKARKDITVIKHEAHGQSQWPDNDDHEDEPKFFENPHKQQKMNTVKDSIHGRLEIMKK